jgi:hypothetical protein
MQPNVPNPLVMKTIPPGPVKKIGNGPQAQILDLGCLRIFWTENWYTWVIDHARSIGMVENLIRASPRKFRNGPKTQILEVGCLGVFRAQNRYTLCNLTCPIDW